MNKEDVWICEHCGSANEGLKCIQCGASYSLSLSEEETIKDEFESPYFTNGGTASRKKRIFNAVWAD